MTNIKKIRTRLGLTQSEFAKGIGCTQGNIGHLESGRPVSSAIAIRIIEFAKKRKQVVTFDEIFAVPPVEKQR